MHCDFCDEFGGGRRNAYADRYGQCARRAILANSRFHVIPTLGQLVEGHLLIVPDTHFCALANLPSNQIVELDSLMQLVRSRLNDAYGECTFFEHGIRDEGAGGCGIDHAHMHAVPVAADGVLNTLKQEFGGSRIDSLKGIRDSLPDGSSYLFFENFAGDRYLFPVNNLPSQYMRKLVAESIGKSNWDWRACGCEPELISTIQRLSPLFSPDVAAGHRG
jgi:diadenosine tetraphosphate (Ap4A) HIT family hydrolase